MLNKMAIKSCIIDGLYFVTLCLLCVDISSVYAIRTASNDLESESWSSNNLSSIFLQKLQSLYGVDLKLDLLLKNISNFIYDSKNITICAATNRSSCIENECLSIHDVYHLYDVEGESVSGEHFLSMLPGLVYALQANCDATEQETDQESTRITGLKVWGMGFLCVTLINLCALLGMVFLPLMSKHFYTRLLMFMVALGVGTLTGSSLLFLIPECFGMTKEGSEHYEDYILKSTTIIGGIYMFFLVERVLQSIMDRRKVTFVSEKYKETHAHEEQRNNTGSVKLEPRTRHDSTSMNMSFQVPDVRREHSNESEHASPHSSGRSPVVTPRNKDSHQSDAPLLHNNAHNCACGGDRCVELPCSGHHDAQQQARNGTQPMGHSHGASPRQIKSVAWMVVFGDGVHNFIDGLSIGAAFTNSLLAGFSVSIAVICEELPHELGDFAILLNSGMSMRQALLFNFLSACMCYVGLVLGILIGEMTHGSSWIFAISGGMFLYISLVDMLPEVNHAAQEEVKETGNMWPPFFIQNAGLLTGYGLMIFMASFTNKIDFESLF